MARANTNLLKALNMRPADLVSRIEGRYQRFIGARCHRREVVMQNRQPLFSFTFDDFPISALSVGGAILQRHGLRGTFYASLGLMGTRAPTGEIFVADDLMTLFEQGHELACHTFSHPDTWRTSPADFVRTVLENAEALERLRPGRRFRSFSYPISGPRCRTKQEVGRLFESCRGGGQAINAGVADLNLLKSFFLEKSRDHELEIKAVIEENRRRNGWLIFSTHDVCDTPTSFGVTPKLFEHVVQWCLESGGRVLTVGEAVAVVAGRH
jgi:peptidoglycan/xylan/chitin deacetylase (PgdA/CDA1 family)